MRTAFAVVVALAAVCPALPGCSSGGPKVSGFGLFDSRSVKVGDTVEFRLPYDLERGLEWRVDSYDSLYLVLKERLQVELEPGQARGEMIVRMYAKTPGDTSVSFRRRGSEETKEFKISISQ